MGGQSPIQGRGPIHKDFTDGYGGGDDLMEEISIAGAMIHIFE